MRDLWEDRWWEYESDFESELLANIPKIKYEEEYYYAY